MKRKSTYLQTRYENVRASLHCEATEEDYRRIGEKLRILSEMARIENRSVSVYDIKRKTFLVKEDRHIELLGYDSTIALDADTYHSMIHADDLPFLYDAEIRMYEFLRPMRSEEKKNYKLIYDYRVRARNGSYIRFLHQLLVYELDRNFDSWLMLILSDVISTNPENRRPRRFLMDMQTQEVCLFNEENGIKRFLITDREKEILELLSQGSDSADVAGKLHISVHTVNNHRRHIMQKAGTKNITQAVTYLRCIGIL